MAILYWGRGRGINGHSMSAVDDFKFTFLGEFCGEVGTSYTVVGNKCYRSMNSTLENFSDLLCNDNGETPLAWPLTAADNYILRCNQFYYVLSIITALLRFTEALSSKYEKSRVYFFLF